MFKIHDNVDSRALKDHNLKKIIKKMTKTSIKLKNS